MYLLEKLASHEIIISSITNFNIDLRQPLSPKKDNSIPQFKIDRTGLTKKNDRTGLTNILKPEQLLHCPVSIKRPGLHF